MKHPQEADIPTQGRFYTFPLQIAPIIKANAIVGTHESRHRHGHFREIPEPGSGFARHWCLCVVRPFADMKIRK
jgi:hypothetical protein